ncbi:MAG: DUF21 domain-containing protein [Planctomycetaceae bacterium]
MLSLHLFFSAVLFLVGLRLSAFFSGTETGFYRVSTLQLTLQKQRGDRVGSALFWFVTHPERFVATTLVGNNVANYLTTMAVGMLVAAVWEHSTGAAEIVATLAMTPVVFIFGELIPKSLYYRAPMSLLRSGSVAFNLFYWLFIPISYPLIQASRFVATLSNSDKRPMEVVFGRTRLYGVLEEGQREGLLTGLQRNLAENLMQVAGLPVHLSMVPASTIRGLSESASVDEVLKLAGETDSPEVLLHAEGRPFEWVGCVRVADLLASSLAPRHMMQQLPVFQESDARLEVLTELFRRYSQFGVVRSQDRVIGIIRRQTLISQLFRVIRPGSTQLETLLTGE